MEFRDRFARTLLTSLLACAAALPLVTGTFSIAAAASTEQMGATASTAQPDTRSGHSRVQQVGSLVAAFSLAAPNGTSPSGLIARAIVAGGTRCPALTTTSNDGTIRSTVMRQRKPAVTTVHLFDALIVCSAPIPARSVTARVLSSEIPHAMPASITNIALLGDTGCEIKGVSIQDCNNPNAWPLARLSTSIAAQKPDLTVFLGDFFYREDTCPSEQTARCGGSPAPGAVPFTDSALGWNADTFIPMAPLLGAAPLVVVRGNHEDCHRAGNGYFLYMDPREGTEHTCAPVATSTGELVRPEADLTQPYAIDVTVDTARRLRLIVVDSAAGYNCEVSPLMTKKAAAYARARTLAKPGAQNWLLVHRPVAAWTPSDDCAPDGDWMSADEQLASYGQLAPYDLILSSHIHLVESMNIPGIPGQLLFGNGGTELDINKPFILPSYGPSWDPAKAYPAPTSGWWATRFGYGMAHPSKASTWTVDMRSPKGTQFARCEIVRRTVNCA